MHSNITEQSTPQRNPINPSVTHFSVLPDDALIDVRVVAILLGRSVNTVWRMAKVGDIEAPVKLGPKTTRWRVSAIRLYLASV